MILSVKINIEGRGGGGILESLQTDTFSEILARNLLSVFLKPV